VLSSQIEGTQSSLSDLLLFENEDVPGVPLNDVQEVSHYVAAMQHGLDRLREGFPLSLRLIREIHEVLLRGGRGAEKTPVTFEHHRTGLEARALAMLHTSPRPQSALWNVWRAWNCSCMTKT